MMNFVTTFEMSVDGRTRPAWYLYVSLGMMCYLTNTCLCQDISIAAGGAPTVVIFSHFTAGTKVRDILAKTTNANQWVLGDTVQVFENGRAGQNPTIFVYAGNTKWSPSNIDPEHRIDSAYKITRATSSVGDMMMSPLAAGNNSLPTVRNCTLAAGLGYVRKSSNALHVYSPMAMRLNNIMDRPDSTVTILYL